MQPASAKPASHPYRTAAPRLVGASAPRPLPPGMSQIERAKTETSDREFRFWAQVTALMFAAGFFNIAVHALMR